MASTIDEQVQRILRRVYSGEHLIHQLAVLSLMNRLQPVHTYEDLLTIPTNASMPDEVRCLACWLLCQLGKPEAIKSLADTYKSSNSTIQACITGALTLLPFSQSVDLLLQATTNPDVVVRLMSAYSLGNMGLHQIRTEEIATQLVKIAIDEDEDLEVRTVAIEALGQTRVKNTQPILLPLLEHKESDIRFWTVYALGQFADSSIIPQLKHIAQSDDGFVPDFGSVRDEAEGAITSIINRERNY